VSTEGGGQVALREPLLGIDFGAVEREFGRAQLGAEAVQRVLAAVGDAHQVAQGLPV
jgi:hypothetical protein